MKFLAKTSPIIAALFLVTNTAFAYHFTFDNKTNKAVAVKLNLVGSMADFDDMAVVKPHSSHKFSLTGIKIGFCLGKISFGALAKPSAKSKYPTFTEATKYTVAEAINYTPNVCRNLAFHITEQYGGGLTLSSANE